MRKRLLYFLLSIVALYSCNRNEPQKISTEQNVVMKTPLQLVQTDQMIFELDSVTAPRIPVIQFVDSNEGKFLVYMNDDTGDLYENDIVSRKIIKKISVKDGMESHNKVFQGFYYHNKDSIFLISFKANVTLINDRGDVLRKFPINDKTSTDRMVNLPFNGLWSSTTTPGFLDNNILYMNSVVVASVMKRPLQILLNLSDGISKLDGKVVPPVYQDHNFGQNNFDIYSSTVNTRNNTFVYSFPGSDRLVEYNLSSKKHSLHLANSKYVHDLTEFDKSYFKNGLTDPTLEYFMTVPSYGGIYYDKYRNLYYRLVLLPVEKRGLNYDVKDAPLKQISVIVLDSAFNYLGEKRLERNKYEMFSAFVSKKGLNLQLKPVSDEFLNFQTFSFQ